MESPIFCIVVGPVVVGRRLCVVYATNDNLITLCGAHVNFVCVRNVIARVRLGLCFCVCVCVAYCYGCCVAEVINSRNFSYLINRRDDGV